jgi:uncharacterized membrane protein
MAYEWALYGHLVAAFLFVGGSIAAAVLRIAAIGRERPGDVALLLRVVRPVVPLVAVGLLATVGFGFWLTAELDADLGATWLTITFALVAWLLVVGALTGRQDRHTRELAERLAADGAPASRELARRLRDPVNLALSLSLLAGTLAIVALMVWQPGR